MVSQTKRNVLQDRRRKMVSFRFTLFYVKMNEQVAQKNCTIKTHIDKAKLYVSTRNLIEKSLFRLSMFRHANYSL